MKNFPPISNVLLVSIECIIGLIKLANSDVDMQVILTFIADTIVSLQ